MSHLYSGVNEGVVSRRSKLFQWTVGGQISQNSIRPVTPKVKHGWFNNATELVPIQGGIFISYFDLCSIAKEVQ